MLVLMLTIHQVAIDRLSKFFNAAEVAPYVQRVNEGDVLVQHHPGGAVSGRVRGRTYPDDVCISMKEGAFFWTGELFPLTPLKLDRFLHTKFNIKLKFSSKEVNSSRCLNNMLCKHASVCVPPVCRSGGIRVGGE